MTISRLINTLCVCIGGIITIYANAKAQQETYLLIVGIVFLMFGIYRISRGISSKNKTETNDNTLQSDNDNDS